MQQIGPTLTDLADFLTEPLASSLFQFHPNDLGTPSFHPPAVWEDWWEWAGEAHEQTGTDPCFLLMQYYDLHRSVQPSAVNQPDGWNDTIPSSLRLLIRNARRLAGSREAGHSVFSQEIMQPYHISPPHSKSTASALPGMSPKKAHEVNEMVNFVRNLLKSNPVLSSLRHVVDVGAGQAYLSRALRDRLSQHILALDFSDVQTLGAAKRDAAKVKREMRPKHTINSEPAEDEPGRPSPGISPDNIDIADIEATGAPCGSLTYMTTKIDESTLQTSTDAWIKSNQTTHSSTNVLGSLATRLPTPVLFVALHACGSLTPDILRAITAAHRRTSNTESPPDWAPQAAVIVGCCYNMLRPEDFPLSSALRASPRPQIRLNINHRQLAAQVPSQWMRSEETLRDARLALRKIVWRALIQETLAAEVEKPSSVNGLDQGPPKTHSGAPKRLGRLSDAAYADWETFAHRVQSKLGLPEGKLKRADRALERRIEVFHVLRCLIGPTIESLILLDRAVWVREMLKASRDQGTDLGVELVNLFDQASGSGRNVAIVIRPRICSDASS
ncbi:methyltransferase domain-containing protein [Trametes gibbosa]|nr:methyltransferase domain-containing protein [Trametes gibbosa]